MQLVGCAPPHNCYHKNIRFLQLVGCAPQHNCCQSSGTGRWVMRFFLTPSGTFIFILLVRSVCTSIHFQNAKTRDSVAERRPLTIDLCNYVEVHLRIIVTIHPGLHTELCCYLVVRDTDRHRQKQTETDR